MRTLVTPRVSETDGCGHINNTVVPIWFEAGRREIFKVFSSDLSFSNWPIIALRMEVEFKKQIYFNADVEIETFISHIGRTSYHIKERVIQNGAIAAEGKIIYVHFDYAQQKPTPIPEEIKSRLLDFFEHRD